MKKKTKQALLTHDYFFLIVHWECNFLRKEGSVLGKVTKKERKKNGGEVVHATNKDTKLRAQK